MQMSKSDGPSGAFLPSYTIDDFCAAEKISRVGLYSLWKQGKGPRYYRNSKRRIITHDARLEFQHAREAEAAAEQSDAAEVEAA
jgi:hypothetical protein